MTRNNKKGWNYPNLGGGGVKYSLDFRSWWHPLPFWLQEAVADTLEQLWISYNNIEKLKGIQVLKKLKVGGYYVRSTHVSNKKNGHPIVRWKINIVSVALVVVRTSLVICKVKKKKNQVWIGRNRCPVWNTEFDIWVNKIQDEFNISLRQTQSFWWVYKIPAAGIFPQISLLNKGFINIYMKCIFLKSFVEKTSWRFVFLDDFYPRQSCHVSYRATNTQNTCSFQVCQKINPEVIVNSAVKFYIRILLKWLSIFWYILPVQIERLIAKSNATATCQNSIHSPQQDCAVSYTHCYIE